jgi:hypothetical protein
MRVLALVMVLCPGNGSDIALFAAREGEHKQLLDETRQVGRGDASRWTDYQATGGAIDSAGLYTHKPYTQSAVAGGGTKFGFFVQLYKNGPAAEKLVTEIRASYPNEPIFLFTDRCKKETLALNFTRLCSKHNCTWSADGEAAGYGVADTSASGGLRYLQRRVDAMKSCNCEYLVNLEDDTCVQNAMDESFMPPADADIGGMPWPEFSDGEIDYFARRKSKSMPNSRGMEAEQEALRENWHVWGCASGCYYRTEFFLQREKDLTLENTLAMREEGGVKVHFGDVIGPAFVLLLGGKVSPWKATVEWEPRAFPPITGLAAGWTTGVTAGVTGRESLKRTPTSWHTRFPFIHSKMCLPQNAHRFEGEPQRLLHWSRPAKAEPLWSICQ